MLDVTVWTTAPAFSTSIFTSDPAAPEDVQVILWKEPRSQDSPPLGEVSVREGNDAADTIVGSTIVKITNPRSSLMVRDCAENFIGFIGHWLSSTVYKLTNPSMAKVRTWWLCHAPKGYMLRTMPWRNATTSCATPPCFWYIHAAVDIPGQKKRSSGVQVLVTVLRQKHARYVHYLRFGNASRPG